MYFGFELVGKKEKCHIPSLYDEFTKEDILGIFIVQYNSYVERILRINPQEAKKHETFFAIFKQKIEMLCESKEFSFCENSQKIVDAFYKKDFVTLKKLYKNHPTHPAAKLIFMMFAGESSGLLFNGREFFSNYVYDKIQKRHATKSINFYGDYITIDICKHQKIGVLPSFKYMSLDEPDLANEDIHKALTILQKHNLKQFFIAYPKNSTFKRHILVKQQQASTQLKLVPYAISHKIVYNNKNI